METSGKSAADVVIAGAGHAGGAAARALRALGFTGSILLVGAERHMPHERPPLSKEALSEPAWQLPVLATAEEWEALGVQLILADPVLGGEAGARVLFLASGHRVSYASLIVATGATPRRMAGAAHPARFVLRTFDDATAIRARLAAHARVVIVGGGPIGLEAAANLRPLVGAVHVVEASPYLMARCAPADLARQLAERHEANGVEILLSSPVRSVAASGDGLSVALSSGRTLDADLVIEGIGVLPETRLAEALKLTTADGVVVDAGYRTSDPAIFAIGDCARTPVGRQETWSHAESSARAAARSILGLAPEPVVIPYFWTDQHGSRLQVAGRLDGAEQAATQGAARLYSVAGTITAVAAIDAPRDFAAARRLIGKPVPDQAANQRPPMASDTLRQLS